MSNAPTSDGTFENAIVIGLYAIVALVPVVLSLASRIVDRMPVWRKLRRPIPETPPERPMPMGELVDGKFGTVCGMIALDEEALAAPFSQRACVHYEMHVQAHRAGIPGDGWQTVIRDSGSCDFVVRAGTDVARVEMTRARVKLMDARFRAGVWLDMSAEVDAFLRSRGHSTDRWTNAPMRYQVAVLEPGERVTVHGLVGSDVAPSRPDAGSGYRGGPRYPVAATRRVLRAPPGGSLILTAPEDGGAVPPM